MVKLTGHTSDRPPARAERKSAFETLAEKVQSRDARAEEEIPEEPSQSESAEESLEDLWLRVDGIGDREVLLFIDSDGTIRAREFETLPPVIGKGANGPTIRASLESLLAKLEGGSDG